MRPPLGDVDAIETEIVRLAAQPQDQVCACLKWRERDPDTARLFTLWMADALIGSPTKRVVLMRAQARASSTRFRGVSAARRTEPKPPSSITSRRRASPACVPSPARPGCERDPGVQTSVENP